MKPGETRSDLAIYSKKFETLKGLIGNTPLVAITLSYKARTYTIYAKGEYYNYAGSIKDRIALHILESSFRAGLIQPHYEIAEATSGNTGIAFSALGRLLGHNVNIFMPNWMSRERVAMIQGYGANVISISPEQGGFLGSISHCEDYAKSHPYVFLPRQFSNKLNSEAHYLTTGPEIHRQLMKGYSKSLNGFVAGVGTGGTVMGVGKYFKSLDSKINIIPVEPAESPTLSTGYKVGKHRIQGISDEFIPDLLDLKSLDPICAIPDGDAILMAQKLSRDLGLGVGISSGANILAALKLNEQLGTDAVVATILCDDNKKYLSTDLMKNEPVKEDYLSPQVQLLDMQ